MYCRNCGAELGAWAVCPKCRCGRGTGVSHCPQCGGITAMGMKFCTLCGAALGQPIPCAVGKSRTLAGLLGLFLGCFGVHNFLLGYTGKGVAQLLVTLLSFFLLAPVSGIWGFVEGVLILSGAIQRDARGVPLIG